MELLRVRNPPCCSGILLTLLRCIKMTGPEHPRAHPRQRTLKGARIIFNNGQSSYDVVIRDLSEGGAKLKLGAATWIVPDHFDLIVSNANTGTPTRHHCEKRWQRGDLVGARFLQAPQKRLPAAPAAANLRQTLTRP